MILAVNVGNTHITFGLIESGEILNPVMNIKTDMKQTSFGYASEMKQVLELSNFDLKMIDTPRRLILLTPSLWEHLLYNCPKIHGCSYNGINFC